MPAAIPDKSVTPALPLEIVCQIVSNLVLQRQSFIETQSTLWACTLISRVWYAGSIALLYQRPYVTGNNYDRFVLSICPSVNAHVRKNGLADLVKSLDLSRLIHHGSKSMTARLLGRVKSNIERFVAPQATFGVNALAALSHCYKLQFLDLSFVAEHIPPRDLGRAILKLERLESLGYPRSGSTQARIFLSSIPTRVKELSVYGGLQDGPGLSPLNPQASEIQLRPILTSLTLAACTKLTSAGVVAILTHFSYSLESLRIGGDMTALREYPLDGILAFLTSLRNLSIPVDYITDRFFRRDFGRSKENPYPLEAINLDCIWPAGNQVETINSDLIWDAVADGAFGRLRRVALARKLELPVLKGLGESSEELNQLLKALAREDGQEAQYSEDRAGVYVFGP